MDATMITELPTVTAMWNTGAEFLENYVPGTAPKLFCPVASDDALPADVKVGATVSLLVRFTSKEADFHVHATVVDCVSRPSERGLVLEFEKDEHGRLELILAFARGESVAYRRRRPRVTLRVPIQLRTTDGGKYKATTTNINEGGLHVAMDRPLAADERVELSMKLPTGKRVRVRGRVVQAIDSGPQRGIAVEFLFASAEERELVAAQVETLRNA
jgi:hypothetical protein